MQALLLLIIGVVSLVVELLLPGFGIFGIVGAIAVFISWAITIFSGVFGIFIVAIEIIIISLAFIFIIKKLKRMQIYGKIILTDVIRKEKKEISNLEELIGKEGVAKTDIKPFGRAEFNGIILDVYSDTEYIKVLSKIKVTRVFDNKMYVSISRAN